MDADLAAETFGPLEAYADKSAGPPPTLQTQQFQNVSDAPAVKPANPKQAFGDKKPPLGFLPMAGKLAQLSAHYDGGLKYDFYNWRDTHVEAMTYVHAALRHLELFSVGEELTRDTKIKNLGAVMACCAILLDAQEHGTLIDNRRKSQRDADLLHEGEAWVAHLKAMQGERDRLKREAADVK